MNCRTVGVFAIGLLASLSACQRPVVSGPPELRLGRDQCAHCGMMISDDRFAGSLLVGADDPEALVFDDIGCMLEYDREHAAETRGAARFVRDYQGRCWLAAADAHYLCCDRERLRTPMGSGVVAFGTLAAAENKRAECGGRVGNEATALAMLRESAMPDVGASAPAPPG